MEDLDSRLAGIPSDADSWVGHGQALDASIECLLQSDTLGGLRVEPATRFGHGPIGIRLETLRRVPELAGEAVLFELRATDSNGQVFWTSGWKEVGVGATGSLTSEFSLTAPALPHGRTYRLELVDRSGVVHSWAPWSSMRREPSELRSWVETNLAVVVVDLPVDDPLFEASIVLDWRMRGLTNDPVDVARQYRVDPIQRYAELDAELTHLRDGENPYLRRAGHLWRPVVHGRDEHPVRVYAPLPRTETSPVPLLVAFHDAWTDESFFVESRGLFDLVEISDRQGFVLAAPHTPNYTNDAGAYASLVDALVRSHAIDPTRVYILGHGAGGECVAGLLRAEAGPMTGAACIAGAGELRGSVPTLVVASETDPIGPPDELLAVTVDAIAEGVPVTFLREARGGHTLLLRDALPVVLEFFGLDR